MMHTFFFFLPHLCLLTDGHMVAHSCTQTGTVVLWHRGMVHLFLTWITFFELLASVEKCVQWVLWYWSEQSKYLDRGRAKAAKSAPLSTGKINSTYHSDICTRGVSALGCRVSQPEILPADGNTKTFIAEGRMLRWFVQRCGSIQVVCIFYS